MREGIDGWLETYSTTMSFPSIPPDEVQEGVFYKVFYRTKSGKAFGGKGVDKLF